MTRSDVRHLAVICASEGEALTLVYKAVCFHMLGKQFPARISPVSRLSVDIEWSASIDKEIIRDLNPEITIIDIVDFVLGEDDKFPNPEHMRADVLVLLRNRLTPREEQTTGTAA